MKRTLYMLAIAAVLGTAAIAAWRRTQATPAGPAATGNAALEGVLDLVANGRLDTARNALQSIQPDANQVQVHRLIEERASLARHLVAQARESTHKGDLQAAGRALAFAIELDEGVDAGDAAAAHDARAAQAEAAVARAAACAARRDFACLRDAVEAARSFDRHNPSAAFWSVYLSDWRPLSEPVARRTP
jgi:hypothetical protein